MNFKEFINSLDGEKMQEVIDESVDYWNMYLRYIQDKIEELNRNVSIHNIDELKEFLTEERVIMSRINDLKIGIIDERSIAPRIYNNQFL